jgi:hypothetical protein
MTAGARGLRSVTVARRAGLGAWIDGLDLDAYWRFVLPLAAGGLAASCVIVATTFLPGDPPAPDGIEFLLFPIVLAGGFGTVASEQQLRRDGRRLGGWPSALFLALPKAQRVALLALIVVSLVIVGLSFVRLRGQPEQHGDRYYLNYQGELTAVTRETYIEQRKFNLRVFAGGPGVFCAVAVGAGLGHRRRYLVAPPPDPWPGPDFDPDVGSIPPPAGPRTSRHRAVLSWRRGRSRGRP